MNESQTRLEKIDPALRRVGWGVVEDSHISVEYPITNGRVSKSVAPKPLKADYVLWYKGVKLGVVEAKSDEKDYSEAVPQAKKYAQMLDVRYSYATNGDKIYAMDMQTGTEDFIEEYPTPQELWQWTFGDCNEWRDKFYEQPLFSNGTKRPRYYQEIAINRTLTAIANGKNRILLTLATGTGKTFIAFQIAWKLFQTKWNVRKTDNRPRILFLADRNTLADQAFNGFFGFQQDALVRITPEAIKKKGAVPTNGSVFFSIFQTFMTDDGQSYRFGEYPKDFFDLVIIDECHRGGANDESNWRSILEYFDGAVQIGLTATPKRTNNADTYRYFGNPIYQYSLKQGIADGFLTPFRHRKMQSTIDDYMYSPEDEILSGEVEKGKVYKEEDFYKGNIKIKQRDEARVKEFMNLINPDEKTIVFCATQDHAGQIRDMINRLHKGNPNYAVRVTANDGDIGEMFLKEFQDNEKTIPTILTTSQKLSTGVDALNVRNIVLLRPVKSMIEFKQIIGRGTRLYDGKYYFTIYDFVKAYENFQDPEWDGEPVCPKCGNNPCTCEEGEDEGGDDDKGGTPKVKVCPVCGKRPCICPKPPCPVCGQRPCVCPKPEKLEIRLSNGTVRKIKFTKYDMFFDANCQPVSAEDFIKEMFGNMPEFFSSLDDLKEKWSSPKTREELLAKLADAGYSKETLENIRTVIDAEDSDIFDVLEYVAYNIEPINRTERVEKTKPYVLTLSSQQQDFVNYVSELYISVGYEELGASKLPEILKMKYGTAADGITKLGGLEMAKNTYNDYQKSLYMW